jgi:predicted dehydrogenase
MNKLKIAIIGCKNMGQKHLKTLRENFADTVEVVGILNSTPESTKQRAAELNVPYFTSLDEITKDTVDAVIVSTPGYSHADIGEKLLLRGIPCLIEKPLATTLKGCEKLIAAAKTGQSLIVSGHTENYNPAVMRLKEELQAPVIGINGIRTSRNATNKTGISAVSELMIHDLAIVYSLLGNDVATSLVEKRPDLSWENHAVAEMTYKNGASVKLEALREDREVERFMDIKDAKGNVFHIDFMEQRLLKNGEVLTEGGQSLKNELADFIDCVKHKKKPLVDMYEAKSIVKLCLDLEEGITAGVSFFKTKQMSY